jgi:DNA ligase-4
MVVFYDVLLLDDTACIWESYSARRSRLQSVVQHIPGRAILGGYETIDFSSISAHGKLSGVFARAITRRWEGLVLKAYDGPYFSFNGSQRHIKLKKDYIPGLGDTADFAIVGGRRDAKVEQELGMGKLWWTSFYLGCLLNKNDVCRFDARPQFLIVDMIGVHGISKRDILFLNRHGYFREVPFAHDISEYHVKLDLGRVSPPTDQSAEPAGDSESEEERSWAEKLRAKNS